MERLEELFSQIYVKSAEDQYFTQRIGETGELRIDDICNVSVFCNRIYSLPSLQHAYCTVLNSPS
jgi:hypothetical protein